MTTPPATEEHRNLKKLSKQEDRRHALAESTVTGPLIALAVLVVLASIFVDGFFTMRTYSTIVASNTVLGIVTIGVTLLMISGEFDLSVGPMFAAANYMFAFLVDEGGFLVFLGVFLALAVPAFLGYLNGFMVTRTGIPSFIVTLGTRSIFRSIVWVVSGGALLQILTDHKLFTFFNGRLDFVNNFLIDRVGVAQSNFLVGIVWFLLLLFIFHMVLMHTSFGNRIFAVGGNPGAAEAQGVNVQRTRVIMFVIVGLLCGIAGLIDFSQVNSVRVATGTLMELNAIAAAVVGGASLRGGSGSVWGALIGVLLIGTLRSAAILLGMPADNFQAIVGIAIVVAVVFNSWVRKRIG